MIEGTITFISAFLQEAVSGSLRLVIQMALIIIPIMVVIQILQDINLLDKIANMISGFLKYLGMSKGASFPLVIGIVLGLSYGAGLILQAAEEGKMTAKDIVLVNVFLSINHAIFEDTLVFVAIGADGWFLLIARFILSGLAVFFLSRYLERKGFASKPEIGVKMN